MPTISEVKIIDLPKMEDPRGNLSFLEGESQIPFKIERSYWIYDVPGGETRGGHAFHEQHEFIIALSGSFDAIIYDGKDKKSIPLNRSYYGVYIPPGLWRELGNFSTNSLVLVLCSTVFLKDDYISNYKEFIQYKAL